LWFFCKAILYKRGSPAMLKITTQTNAQRTLLDLEGKLAGPWVEELEICWQQLATADRQVEVALRGVTYIDEKGKDLLAKMHRQGIGLVAAGCMTKAIVEEITRGGC
jgi:hypothetical protein